MIDQNKNYCPSCGYNGLAGPAYDGLDHPPWESFAEPPYQTSLGVPSYEVCACCGFEFGFDDDPGGGAEGMSFEAFRMEWIAAGALWFEPELRPRQWDHRDQLRVIGVDAPS